MGYLTSGDDRLCVQITVLACRRPYTNRLVRYLRMTGKKGPIGFGKAIATVNGKKVVTAEISGLRYFFAVTLTPGSSSVTSSIRRNGSRWGIISFICSRFKVMLCLPENKGKIAFFAGIDKARFRGQVLPGDTLELHVEMTGKKGPGRGGGLFLLFVQDLKSCCLLFIQFS